MLKVGSFAPRIIGTDQNGIEFDSHDYKHKWLVLYFYPKDNTPGCTKEACGFRDVYAQLKNTAVVVGVSADTIDSHSSFAQKHELPFTLISDPDKSIIKQYQAWGTKKFMGKEYEGIFRISYLINPEGKIAKVYPNVSTAKHPQEVLEDIKKFQGS